MTSAPARRGGTKAKRPVPVVDAMKVVLESLDESKAEDTVSIDISGKSSIGDAMVVASGRSSRHVGAIAERLLDDLKTAGIKGARVEGQKAGDWVLIDIGDIIVHIFQPDVRSFYNLEKMWQSDPIGGPHPV